MNKESLAKGNLNIQDDISFVRFKSGNRVEAEFNFGCAVMIYGSDKDEQMDQVDHQID